MLWVQLPCESLTFAAQMIRGQFSNRLWTRTTAVVLMFLLLLSALSLPEWIESGYTKTEFADTHAADSEAPDTNESKDGEKELSEDVFDLCLSGSADSGLSGPDKTACKFTDAEDLPLPGDGGVNNPPPETANA